nr:hypothetical protein [uncultured Roseateles sp.]
MNTTQENIELAAMCLCGESTNDELRNQLYANCAETIEEETEVILVPNFEVVMLDKLDYEQDLEVVAAVLNAETIEELDEAFSCFIEECQNNYRQYLRDEVEGAESLSQLEEALAPAIGYARWSGIQLCHITGRIPCFSEEDLPDHLKGWGVLSWDDEHYISNDGKMYSFADECNESDNDMSF